MKKKLFAFLLLFCLILTSPCVYAEYASVGSANFSYEVDGDSIRVTQYQSIFMDRLEIPEMIDGKPVTTIASGAFWNCSKLKNVTLPKTLKTLESIAFVYCTGIQNLYISDLAAWCGMYIENQDANPLYYAANLYVNGVLTKNIVIPDGVTSIGQNAFRQYEGLAEVTIPASVTHIGSNAFYECKNMKKLHITDIGAWCNINFENKETNPMYYTEGMYLNGEPVTQLEIPDGVTSISANAFYNNQKMETVIIPESVTNIGDSAFGKCSGIKRVLYQGDEAQWENVTVGNSNTALTKAEIVFRASEKTYSFETNSDEKISDVVGYMVSEEPIPKDENKVFSGWYDNPELSGDMVEFPYCGAATTLYAKWREKNGTSFDEAIPTELNRDYTVTIAEPNRMTYYKLKPSRTDEYRIFSSGNLDTTVQLFTSSQELILSDPDTGNANFCMTPTLNAGETYYIAVTSCTEAGAFTLHVRKNRCTYKFVKEDGTTVLESTVPYGTVLEEIPAGPAKEGNQQYTYAFAGWEGYTDGLVITQDVCFTPKYTHALNQYTYQFIDEDGTVLLEKTEDYGTKIEVPQNPFKPSTAQYTYTFTGWEGYSEGMTLTEDVTFTAKYESITNRYTYQFVDEDGTVLLEKREDYGTKIEVPQNPFKPSTAQYTYTFTGWEGYSEGMLVTQDAVFTANYHMAVNCYTYQFISEGKVVSEITAEYGTEIKLPADPVKNSTQQYTYIFSGWDGYTKGMTLTKDITFTAAFHSRINQYTYQFRDNGKVIFEKTVDYGTEIELPKNPHREPTQEYTYTFDGWDGYTKGMKITEDVSFISRYIATVNQYTYKFVNYDGSVVSEGTRDFGTEIPNSPTPTKPSTQQFVYTFAGWSGYTSGMKLTGDVTFTALYNEVLQKYTYQFICDGNVYHEKTVDYGTAVQLPENPVKPATAQYSYTFAEWEGYNENMVVTGDCIFTAKYNVTTNQYTYQFMDEEGNVLLKKTADYGTAITNAPDVPFKGISIIGAWQNYTDGMELTEDITFVPVYTYKDYTITISDTTETTTVTYNKDYHIHPAEKEGYAFVGYFDEPESNGNRLTDENGDSYAPYTVDGDSTVYPYYVPAEQTENQMKFLGDTDVFIGHPSGIRLSAVLKNYQGNGSYFRLTFKLPKNIIPEIIENEYWTSVRHVSRTVQDGIAEVTYHCNFSKTEPHDPILELCLKTREPMEAGNAVVRITDASVIGENEETIKEYGEKFAHNVMLRHHSIDAMEISGADTVFGELSTYSVHVTPSYADKSVTWSIDDETVATIDENGVLTPLREGHAVITARSLLDDTIYATKHIEVKVMKLDSMTTDIGVWDKPFDPYDDSYTIYVDESANVVTMTATFTEDGVLHFSGNEVKSGEGKRILLNKNEVKTSCIFRSNTTLASKEYSFTFIKRNGIYANVSEDKSVVDVDLVGAPENTAVLVAYFKNKKLVGLQNQIYAGEKLVFHINDDYRTLKVLAWHKLDRPAPVFPAETFVFD
ncbi:MAG: leucine-rich repeat protein [Clostridia bacterium]|nr:leucine-rich repeat protein [Clostridia bacterium]